MSFYRFYNVTEERIDWMSLVYMWVYVPLVFPVTFLLERTGLRIIALIACLLNTVGAVIKTLACQPHLYQLAFIGQITMAIANVSTLSFYLLFKLTKKHTFVNPITNYFN